MLIHSWTTPQNTCMRGHWPLPQHWHRSSKGNMEILSTNSRKHTCFVFFFCFAFKYRSIVRSSVRFFLLLLLDFPLRTVRDSQDQPKPYSAKWEKYIPTATFNPNEKLLKTNKHRKPTVYRSGRTRGEVVVTMSWRVRSNPLFYIIFSFYIFFGFSFNIKHIRHAFTTITTIGAPGSNGAPGLVCLNTIKGRLLRHRLHLHHHGARTKYWKNFCVWIWGRTHTHFRMGGRFFTNWTTNNRLEMNQRFKGTEQD